MDKMGIGSLVIGLVFCALGIYSIWVFLPQVIIAVEGLIGIVLFLIGLMAVTFGILIAKE